ncbi:MAG TPA: biotin synthase BioB [Candidatus Binatia bacterium]|nr:biotin synthase BioB [Candidatus Binatia bacterium]
MDVSRTDTATALARAGRYRPLAERALADEPLPPAEARALMASPDEELAAVLWAAFAVRHRHFGRAVKLCVLSNARSGLCPEDCGYCSQSAVSNADIPRYRLKSVAELVAAARRAAATGARRYCMVTSARGPSTADVAHFARAARAIRAELPDLELCVSLGILGEGAARELRAAGVDFVNHNLNTSRRFYPAICTTHTWDDRVATVAGARRAGLHACSGVIVGMGETDDDLIDVAGVLGALAVTSLPVNFLHPIDGTPLADRPPPPPGRCLRALALFRLTSPRAEIRAAGGRERCLGAAQGLALFAASSIFVEGYLTTPGQAHAAARDMITALGFQIEAAPDGQVQANVL